MGWVMKAHPDRFTPRRDQVPIVQEAGWVPVPVWTGAGNLAATGSRSPDYLAHKQSLYRLRYPVQLYINTGMCASLSIQTRVFKKCKFGSHLFHRRLVVIYLAFQGSLKWYYILYTILQNALYIKLKKIHLEPRFAEL
jgi:hypothetical protein